MHQKQKKIFTQLMGLVVIGYFLTAGMCTKVVAYGTDNHTDPVAKEYSSNLPIVMEQAEKAFTTLGYDVVRVDNDFGRLRSGWRATAPDSHYLLLFDRKDFSANAGAYYQLLVDVKEEAGKVRVSVSTVVKSISGELLSNHVAEKDFLTLLSRYLRSPQIIMTNVGVEG
ncbi:MAG: hypothetical protein H7A33_03010 [Deltaproteobacteria bacterium]|nr:hypothetical protein [Deltaproteobacteria bacterium]